MHGYTLCIFHYYRSFQYENGVFTKDGAILILHGGFLFGHFFFTEQQHPV